MLVKGATGDQTFIVEDIGCVMMRFAIASFRCGVSKPFQSTKIRNMLIEMFCTSHCLSILFLLMFDEKNFCFNKNTLHNWLDHTYVLNYIIHEAVLTNMLSWQRHALAWIWIIYVLYNTFAFVYQSWFFISENNKYHVSEMLTFLINSVATNNMFKCL